MTKLLPVTIICMMLAVLSHYSSGYDIQNNRYYKKDWIIYTILTIVMVFFVGLRTSYNDTHTYMSIYRVTSETGELSEGINWLKFGENPGFVFTNRLLKRWDFSTQSYLMFYAAITVSINMWFIRKYSCNIFLSVFLYFAFAGYLFALAAVKQCMSMALCLLATDRAIRKKYISFLLFVFLAMTYHAYAFMYLAVPFLAFRPWSGKTVILFIVFGVLGVSLQTLMGSLVNVTDMLGEGYDTQTFAGEGVHPLRLIVTAAPMIVSALTAEHIGQEKDRAQYIFLNLTMLNAEIMFVGLFGTANYFGRLANYFIPFQALSLPWVFTHFDREGKRWITTMAVVGHSLFLIYSLGINDPFDNGYSSITFWEYLESLMQ